MATLTSTAIHDLAAGLFVRGVCAGDRGSRLSSAAGMLISDLPECSPSSFQTKASRLRMDMEDYEIHQMPIADIATKTGLTFDASLLKADALKAAPGLELSWLPR